MAKEDFIEQLRLLGFEVKDLGDSKVAFPYVVRSGKFADQNIQLGFIVPGDFPITPPSGPHVSPRLLPLNTSSNVHPSGGIHESPQFGSDWEYWSRPMNNWSQTKRTVKEYLAHIRHLFDTQ